MRPELFAMLSALGWAGDAVLVRLGTRASNVVAAAFLSYSVSTMCLWSYVLSYFSFDLLWSRSTIFFVLSGSLQPLLARILYYMGLTRLGVSRAGPLLGTAPLFAMFIAVLVLREQPAAAVYAGTVLTVVSVWLISSRRAGEREWRLFDIMFPLGAAFFAAVSQNLRKGGLLITPDPFLAAAVNTTTSLVLFSIFLLVTGRIGLIKTHRQSLPYFGVAAFIATTAQILTFVALTKGEVSVIVPLLNTNPLFSVLFSSLFLRSAEVINWRVISGAILMVAAVVIITSR